jgi:hypothetical protein
MGKLSVTFGVGIEGARLLPGSLPTGLGASGYVGLGQGGDPGGGLGVAPLPMIHMHPFIKAGDQQ